MNLNGSGQTNSGISGNINFANRRCRHDQPAHATRPLPILASALGRPLPQPQNQRINQRLEDLAVLKTGQRIAAYLASPEEAAIDAFIELAWQRQQSIFLPCIDSARGQMTFVQYHPDAPLKENRFGLLEPADRTDIAQASELNCALVPLVAFDGLGNRLGMGGGYYDRFLLNPTGGPL